VNEIALAGRGASGDGAYAEEHGEKSWHREAIDLSGGERGTSTRTSSSLD